jgi:demethylmenaquinone methyltransferase / 2-methoxy-6-polyprenyl-1,4-benzoquinol methylase
MTTNSNKLNSNAANFHTLEDDVFGRIAERYDLLSDLFSLGIHRLWKRRVAKLIAAEPWTNLLDAASGTGDVILRVAQTQKLLPNQKIVASDISPQMLAIAQKRAKKLALAIEFCILDTHSMPSVASGSVDLYAISLCLKICDRQKALTEAFRVLKPGGRLISLEASNLPWPWLQRIYLAYMKLCMPLIGWAATGGDASAYQYLLKGIEDFPKAEELAKEMTNMGFENVLFERLSLGIVAIHVGRKPLNTPHFSESV